MLAVVQRKIIELQDSKHVPGMLWLVMGPKPKNQNKTAEVQFTRLCPYLKNQRLNYLTLEGPSKNSMTLSYYDFSGELMTAKRMTTSLILKTEIQDFFYVENNSENDSDCQASIL